MIECMEDVPGGCVLAMMNLYVIQKRVAAMRCVMRDSVVAWS